MYNKISPIILNSGKANGASDVFISQPDSHKESLAGKIFVLAEIDGKKNDSQKVISFLIDSLEDYYYNDEKIVLRDKIEGLRIENIFEAALAKTNKAFSEFLTEEKIKLNPSATNITLGVVFENKLHFANYGRNRALLIYPRQQQYEIVNIEASATDSAPEKGTDLNNKIKTPKLFSSVISGDVPENAYFIFTSEALPEYLSDKELIDIVTKLPPIVAAEQIKNVLAKINSYVPFLGIIVKNTSNGLEESRKEIIDNLSAHSSISALNHTEQKTEEMLAPAGLVDLRKVVKNSVSFLGKFSPKKNVKNGSVREEARKEEEKNVKIQKKAPENSTTKLNFPRKDSFLIKDKIIFKKKSNRIISNLKRSFFNLPKTLANLMHWSKSLNKKNQFIFVVLVAIVVVFLFSLLVTNINNKKQLARQEFNDLVAKIEEKQNLIDSHLLYNDEEGAKIVLNDAKDILNTLPIKKRDQKEAHERLDDKMTEQEEKIQKIIRVDELEKVADLSGLNINTLAWVNGQIYSANTNTIYEIKPGTDSSIKHLVEANNLGKAYFDGKNSLYYLSNNKIVEFNINTKESLVININDSELNDIKSFRVFSRNLYILANQNNQVHRYRRAGGEFNARVNWLQTEEDLSNSSDLAIDGRIYTLNSDGSVYQLYKGQKQEYGASSLSPKMNNANKLIVGDKYLYLLDPDTKRLAVLAKEDGHLMNQYQMDSLNNIADFTVNESDKSAYILSESSIYQVKLKQ